MKRLKPVYITDLFEPLHTELIALLGGLSPEDWTRPTVAGSWRVRDVVAPLLDNDLCVLSSIRDGHSLSPTEPPLGGATRVAQILESPDFTLEVRRSICRANLRGHASLERDTAIQPGAIVSERRGLSSCGRPPVHSVRRPLRQLVAYGSTNKYRPLNRSRASGSSGE